MDKKEVRKQIRELKKLVSLEEKKQKSVSIWDKVEQDEHFKKAKVVLAYWSMDDEVFTHDFICKWAEQKCILLPCVRGDELDIRYFEGKDKLCTRGEYAIQEPVGELFTKLDEIDLILVPGIAFDKDLNRLGRGKGYYDKILKQTHAYTIGVCFDFQFLNHIPTEEHDVKMNSVCYCE